MFWQNSLARKQFCQNISWEFPDRIAAGFRNQVHSDWEEGDEWVAATFGNSVRKFPGKFLTELLAYEVILSEKFLELQATLSEKSQNFPEIILKK